MCHVLKSHVYLHACVAWLQEIELRGHMDCGLWVIGLGGNRISDHSTMLTFVFWLHMHMQNMKKIE